MVTALYDYDAQDTDELSFRKDEEIELLEKRKEVGGSGQTDEFRRIRLVDWEASGPVRTVSWKLCEGIERVDRANPSANTGSVYIPYQALFIFNKFLFIRFYSGWP